MKIPLSQCSIPSPAKTIVSIEGPRTLCLRLEELGFVPGEIAQVIKQMAFGGALIVALENSNHFALRLDEAECIFVDSQESRGT